MRRSATYIQGFRHASKEAVTWLQREAGLMNDPKARDILHSAAFRLGGDLKRMAGDLPPSAPEGE
jgi:hypothetical protein